MAEPTVRGGVPDSVFGCHPYENPAGWKSPEYGGVCGVRPYLHGSAGRVEALGGGWQRRRELLAECPE